MAGELKATDTPGSGKLLYGVLFLGALTWNGGNTFAAPTRAIMNANGVPVTEVDNSGVFLGNFPTAIITPGHYDILLYEQQGTGYSVATDVRLPPAFPVEWTGAAQLSTALVLPANVATGAAGGLPTGNSAGAVALAAGAIDVPQLTAALRALLLRAYLVGATGTTAPVTADTYAVAGMYQGVPYYLSSTLATPVYCWTDGSAWYLTATAPGVTLPAGYFKTAPGATAVGPYFLQGTATGSQALNAHGNAVLSAFQPESPVPTAASIAAAVFATLIETGVTMQQLMEALGAYAAGNTDGSSLFDAIGNPGTVRLRFTENSTTGARTVTPSL